MTKERIEELRRAVNDDWNNEYTKLQKLISELVKDAHIAGSLSTKGTGLNLSKEERAVEYCKEKGLST